MKLLVFMFFVTTATMFAHHEAGHQVNAVSLRIAEKPSSSLLTYRASLFIKAGKLSEAKKDLKQALELDPSYRPAKKLQSQLLVK
jgi:predicted Zn-dependent protease